MVVAGSSLSAVILAGLACARLFLDEVYVAGSIRLALPDEGLAFPPRFSLSAQLHGL